MKWNRMSDDRQKPSTRLIACPRCRKSVRYDVRNPFRPFCSAVCKNEDIVSWAEASYRIAGEAAEEQVPEQEPGEEES
jgi:endogenous inhibitor of DNA gyrase (YacG/DUF329 family)